MIVGCFQAREAGDWEGVSAFARKTEDGIETSICSLDTIDAVSSGIDVRDR